MGYIDKQYPQTTRVNPNADGSIDDYRIIPYKYKNPVIGLHNIYLQGTPKETQQFAEDPNAINIYEKTLEESFLNGKQHK